MRIVAARLWPFTRIGFLFEFRDELRLAIEPCVDCVVAQIKKKRHILMPLDKLDGF